MTKTLDGNMYDIIGAAMKIHNTLGTGATRNQHRKALLNKLRALEYKVAKADAIPVVDEDGDTILTLQPDFWIAPLRLLITVVVSKRNMGYKHAEEARNYLRHKPDAESVLLLNCGMRTIKSWKFERDDLNR